MAVFYQQVYIVFPVSRKNGLIPLKLSVPNWYRFWVEISKAGKALLSVTFDISLEESDAHGGQAVGWFGESLRKVQRLRGSPLSSSMTPFSRKTVEF